LFDHDYLFALYNLVSTFCVGFDCKAPLFWAFARIALDGIHITSSAVRRKTLPRSVVIEYRSAKRFTTSGSAAMA